MKHINNHIYIEMQFILIHPVMFVLLNMHTAVTVKRSVFSNKLAGICIIRIRIQYHL